MAEYFIGMHGRFDDEKYARDFIDDEFTGIEFCSFTNREEIAKITEVARKDKFKIGIHFPLDKSNYMYRDPLLIALNENERDTAFEAVEREIAYAKLIKSEYLLIHFPKPMPLDKKLDWDKCKFPTDRETIDESSYPYELFKMNCFNMFKKLSELSTRNHIQIVLEIEMLNKYLYKGTLLKELLEAYPNIKLCLDSARIHVLSMIDRKFNYKKFIKEMAEYTYLVHLSNIKVTDKIENGHHPVLKRLKSSDGWSDIDTFLKIIASENKNMKILFEHRSDVITYEELIECYKWVKSYF